MLRRSGNDANASCEAPNAMLYVELSFEAVVMQSTSLPEAKARWNVASYEAGEGAAVCAGDGFVLDLLVEGFRREVDAIPVVALADGQLQGHHLYRQVADVFSRQR